MDSKRNLLAQEIEYLRTNWKCHVEVGHDISKVFVLNVSIGLRICLTRQLDEKSIQVI